MPVPGSFPVVWRCSSTTTAHRALPVREWPALGMTWPTARSNAASAVCSRFGGAFTGCCGRAGQVVCGGCGFASSIRKFFSCGGAAWHPLRTEPCGCVNGQPWECHGLLQGQMQPLQCAVDVVGPALTSAARLGRWFVGAAILPASDRFLFVVEALLGIHSVQSPASVLAFSCGHVMGHCKFK